MSVTVTLSRADMDAIDRIAKARNSSKEDAGFPDPRWNRDRTGEAAHRMGFAAEYSVAKYYGSKADEIIRLYGDKGRPDIVVNGFLCEVKCRRVVGFDFALTTNSHKSFVADIGILVYELSPSEYMLWGFIFKEMFLYMCREVDYKHGKRLCVNPNAMMPPEVLRTIRK